MSIIQAKHLRGTHPGNPFKEFSFTLPEGVIMGVLSDNPEQNTQFISYFLGLSSFSAEYFSIFGHHRPEKAAERMGVVLKDSGFPCHFTPKQISTFGGHMYENWAAERIKFLCHQFKIPLKFTLNTLNQQQKWLVSLSFALSHNPDLLVVDVPLDSFSSDEQKEILHILQNFVENAKRSILITATNPACFGNIPTHYTLLQDNSILVSGNATVFLSNMGKFTLEANESVQIPPEFPVHFKNMINTTEYFVLDRNFFIEKFPQQPLEPVTLEEVFQWITKEESND